MPGTTYTRSGPELDPAGRLADFARFAHGELVEILHRLEETRRVRGVGRRAELVADQAESRLYELAGLLEGYTTADDPEPAPINSGGECPSCGRIMSVRERAEQGECNDCHPGGAYSPTGEEG